MCVVCVKCRGSQSQRQIKVKCFFEDLNDFFCFRFLANFVLSFVLKCCKSVTY